MNPAGFVFGESSRLNVPANFTATTAQGIGFADGWFNAIGENSYQDLVGSPTQLLFSDNSLETIVNGEKLTVESGEVIKFLDGTFFPLHHPIPKTLTKNEGQITIAHQLAA